MGSNKKSDQDQNTSDTDPTGELESWPETLPDSAVTMLQKTLWSEARHGVVVLTKERTAYLLDRFNQLKMNLKINGAIQLPLVGRFTPKG